MSPTATPLVYILAASHSGSTLLGMLLGAHPEVCTAGELKANALGDLERYRCSCGAPIRACPFWRRVGEWMAARGVSFDLARAGTDLPSLASPAARRLLRPLHRGAALERIRDAALALCPGWREALAAAQRRNALLAECVRELSGARVVVDTSKIGIRLKYLLRNPGLDVRVVRLVRDGRGVALTYMDPARFADARDARLRGGGMGGDRASERLPLAAAAREWRRSNEEAEHLLAGLDPARWTEARYEELCGRPQQVLERLHAFIGVDPRRTSLDFRAREHHVVGNGMRLDSSAEVRLDETWRDVLTPRDLQAFDAEAGPLNRRLGYA